MTTLATRNVDRELRRERTRRRGSRAPFRDAAIAKSPPSPLRLQRIASEIPALLDEPQADPGILPKFMICREIARTTKVALTGDGGDELFYGYAVFKSGASRALREGSWPAAVHHRVIRPLTQTLAGEPPIPDFDLKVKQFAKGFPAPDHLRNFYWTSAFSDRDLPLLLRNGHRDFDDLRRQLDLGASSLAQGGRTARPSRVPVPAAVSARLCSRRIPTGRRCCNSVELRTPFPRAGPRSQAQRDSRIRSRCVAAKPRRCCGAIGPQGPAGRASPDARKMGFTAPVAALVAGELKAGDSGLPGAGLSVRRQGLFHEGYVITSARRALHEPP